MALYLEDSNLTQIVCALKDKNAEHILDNEGFLNISQRGLTYVLKGDTFYAPELKIFERTMTWAKNKCNKTDGKLLRQTLGEAFYYLRTPAMTVSDFFACSKRKEFYSVEEYEDIIERILNPSKCTRTMTSNCEVKRQPAVILVRRLPITQIPLVKGKRKESISETLMITVTHECLFSGVKLAYNKSKVVSPDLRTVCQTVEKRVHSSVDVAVMVNDVKLEYKELRLEDSMILELLPVLPLHPGIVYELTVRKESRIKGHYLLPKICNVVDSFGCFCQSVLSVKKALCGSENPSIILEIGFLFKGNKNR